MKYLKKFKTNTDYIIFKNSDKYITPNVCLIEGTDEVHYQVNVPTVAVLFEGMISNRKIKVNERDLITAGVFSSSDLPDLSVFNNMETQSGTSFEPIKVTFKYVTEIGESVLSSDGGNPNPLPLILNFGPNVTSIGENAFAGSLIVSDIVFDKNSNLTTIGEGAFKNCTFNIIDGHEFTGMAQLALPNGITTIGDEAFNGVYNSGNTYNNTLEVSLPPTVVSIGDRVFKDSGFSYFYIPNSITTIPNSTFSNCEAGEMAIIGFHEDTGAVGGLAITIGGQTLTRRDLPKGGIVISDEITSIGDFAFSSFSSDFYFNFQGWQIQSIGDGIPIGIGSGITSIGEGAFTGVPSTQVMCFAETPPTLAENDDPFPDFSDKGIERILEIMVPENSVDAYKTAWPHLADYIVAGK